MTPRRPKVESQRVQRMHMPDRVEALGCSVREADLALRLDGGGNGLLDTTHFDTVRFPPPAWASTVMAEAISDGALAYTPYRGHPDVLASLAPTLSRFLDTPVRADQIVLTPGTQAGLFTALAATVNEGDLVMLADPEYLYAERILAQLGARVVRIPVLHDREQPDLDLDAVEALLPQRPVLFMYSHPHNPTGAVFQPSTLARLAELAVVGDFRILADELYSRLVYPGADYRHLRTMPGMAERCVTTLGPSKTESLSGFRLGVVVAPDDVIGSIEQVLASTSLRAPAYAQHLLTRWITDDSDFVEERVRELAALQEMTVAALRRVPGVRVRAHRGTAYAFVDIRALGVDDITVARCLQEEAGVIVSPGYQFGPSGIGHFRVCYARDELEWAAALQRMTTTLTAFAPAEVER